MQTWFVSRGVCRTLSGIYDEVFCKNSQPLKAVNYFRKTLHLRCLTGFGMPLVSVRFSSDEVKKVLVHGISP